MKNFEELNLFEKKKMILNEIGFEYIPHNSEFNQQPFRNSNEGYFVLKQFYNKVHHYNHKFDILKSPNHNIPIFSNVLPKNSFNPQFQWNDLFKVIDFMLNKELFENENGNKLRNYFDVFDVISQRGFVGMEYLDNIEKTFEALAKYFYNRINGIYENNN